MTLLPLDDDSFTSCSLYEEPSTLPNGYNPTNQSGNSEIEVINPIKLEKEKIQNAIQTAKVCPEQSLRLSQQLSPITPEKPEEYADIILRCSQAVSETGVIKASRKEKKLSQSVVVGRETAYFHGVGSPVVARGSKKKAKECTAISIKTGRRETALRLKDSNVDQMAEMEGAIHERFSSHPNVVSLLDKRSYFSNFKRKMEIYVEKADSTMSQAISNPAFDHTAKAHVMKGIASAVAFMHSENMCHNDLNLGNLFIKNGVGKISDFGLSAPPGVTPSHIFASLVAPEQRTIINSTNGQKEANGVTSFATDVYQFGLALWHVFHPDLNHLHFELDDKALPPDVRYAVPDQENRFAGWSSRTIQQEMVIKLIQDCTQNDPQKRPSMSQVEHRLAEIEGVNDFFNISFEGA